MIDEGLPISGGPYVFISQYVHYLEMFMPGTVGICRIFGFD
jgi:hypothetical protein